MKTYLSLFLIIISAGSARGQQSERFIKAGNGEGIGFLEARPGNYGKEKHPVIIFLHGTDERGNGKSDLHKVATHGIPKIAKTRSITFNGSGFIVLSPQLDRRFGDWQFFYIDEMIKYARTLSIDTNRIYLAGISLGGGGVWSYASASVSNASQFAAIVPVCGVCFYDYKKLVNIAKAGTPVWAFVGEADRVVMPLCTTQAVDAINAAKPAIAARKTVYKGVGHNAWDRAFDPTHKYQRPNVYEWLLTHKRNRK
jgi:predicted peptidase